jgi:hypothetical protein
MQENQVVPFVGQRQRRSSLLRHISRPTHGRFLQAVRADGIEFHYTGCGTDKKNFLVRCSHGKRVGNGWLDLRVTLVSMGGEAR